MYILNVKVFGRFELPSLGSKPGELGRIEKGPPKYVHIEVY